MPIDLILKIKMQVQIKNKDEEMVAESIWLDTQQQKSKTYFSR